jgi:glyoxylase-like metal-dependent hydrolase (beta-lactamase superfamily II)
MALFESYERRIDKINAVLAEYGIASLEEAQKLCAARGFSPADIDMILLTHQDCDHIACVPEFRAHIPGVRVSCHEDEAPYIDGRRLPCKVAALEARFGLMTPAEREDFYPYRKRYMDSRTPVDHTFTEGIAFPHAGGIRVIHTPGHTPGHVSLLAQGILIAGDALNAAGGVLKGPKPDKSEDMALAIESLRRLERFEFSVIACYHGGAIRQSRIQPESLPV